MPTAMYSIYATVGLHVTVPRMPVLQLYESLTLSSRVLPRAVNRPYLKWATFNSQPDMRIHDDIM